MQSDFKKRLTDCGSYIDFLEFYGRDWFDFLPHHKFYTQASWLAFRQIVANTILEKPLTKGEAEAAFKTNGASLLATAIEQKIVHEQRKKNIKEVYILASDELIVGWLSHIERTRDELWQKLAGNKL
ncbi:hypothetical protein [Bradyrhizobium sp. LA6.7]|uniref:hypothetical protein n=1 Tax=unclassified Bradyrhizobium TaxID=2631580 RepID=UPI00339179D4